jgi:hypothetical protein
MPEPNEVVEQQQQEQHTQEETTEQRYARLYSAQGDQTKQELLQAIDSLKTEVATLRTPQTVTQEEDLSPASKTAWVEKIRQGDFEGAQRVIAEEVQRSLKPTLEQVRQDAYNQAIAASQVNLEMDRYLQQVRVDNPELVHFERYLQAPVSQRIEAAKQSGKIKSSEDLVREYKSAVDAEVTQLRNLGLQFRAAGKSEATTRNREVTSSMTLEPQKVTLGQPQQATDTAQPETTESYFARRKADEARRRGLV